MGSNMVVRWDVVASMVGRYRGIKIKGICKIANVEMN
jgi:hypothetical protein